MRWLIRLLGIKVGAAVSEMSKYLCIGGFYDFFMIRPVRLTPSLKIAVLVVGSGTVVDDVLEYVCCKFTISENKR